MAKRSLSSGELTNMVSSYLVIHGILGDRIELCKEVREETVSAINRFLDRHFLPLEQSLPEDTSWLAREAQALLETTMLYLKSKMLVGDYYFNIHNNPEGHLEVFVTMDVSKWSQDPRTVMFPLAIGKRYG